MRQSAEVLKVIIYKVWCKWDLSRWKENKFFINIQLSLSLTSGFNMSYLYINSYCSGTMIFINMAFLMPSSLMVFTSRSMSSHYQQIPNLITKNDAKISFAFPSLRAPHLIFCFLFFFFPQWTDGLITVWSSFRTEMLNVNILHIQEMLCKFIL